MKAAKAQDSFQKVPIISLLTKAPFLKNKGTDINQKIKILSPHQQKGGKANEKGEREIKTSNREIEIQ